jgi:chromosome segregation protein
LYVSPPDGRRGNSVKPLNEVKAVYLKALEIQGFKSFPDKTVLNFGEDITAIVGPNGSGKSNISDAIRWVMGEQSTKNLRGSKMEDVIFGGTEKRAQVGFAQVTLVLDNTEHIFPAMEESEVMVTRRYYRSGESEYYINRQAVRLRDINELFMDTGLGREGYSIIGQGKIDEILSVKSGERREVFEEAAGISKFRHRKEDAEHKLESTEENLVRINDKIAELQLQIDPLRDQAEKAKRYLVLRDELRGLEVSLWVNSLRSIRADRVKTDADFDGAERGLEAAKTALSELYSYTERFGDKMHENDMEAERVRGESAENDAEISRAESELAVLNTNIEHHRANIERVKAEISDQESRAGGVAGQMEQARARIAEIDGKLGALTEEVRSLLAKAEEASTHAGSIAEEAEALRGREAVALAAAADARADKAAAEAGLREVEERLAATAEEKKSAEAQLAETRAKAGDNAKALAEASEEAESVKNIIEGHALRMEGRKKRAADAADKKVRLTMEVGALESRINMLTEMEKEYEGFSKSVRLVMQAAEGGGLRGIHGPVANLVKTDDAYAVAIETALGAGMQNIVVDREEDAKSAITYLKNRDGGRATFLPLTAIRGETLREQGVSEEYGFVGIASELVRYDGKYSDIFKNLLGRTVVVEDLDSGIAISRRYGARFRIVTLDGQVMNRGGSMTGGSAGRNVGILSRANELAKLGEKIGGMREALKNASAEAEEAARTLEAANYELSVAEGQRRQAEDAVLRLTSEQKHYEMLLDAMNGNMENLGGEAAALEGRRSDGEEKLAEADARIAEQDGAVAEIRSAMAEKLSGRTELLELSGTLSERISAGKAELAALAAEKETTERSVADLEELCAGLARDREGREKLIEEYEKNVTDTLALAQAKRSEADALREKTESFKARLSELTQARLALEAERTAKDKESRDKNDEVLNMEREVSRLEQKRATSAMEEKQLLDKLWDSYELAYSDAEAQSVELESTAKANRRTGELRREIGSLGTPNIGAIDEFDRVNTRYEYLTTQRDDVQKAKDELLGVIEEITAEMQKIFAEQFAVLNESFKETFLELFGGGHAQLELEDESDILNCGIDIKVQPPGKTLKTITLLSGGEKAFVAIALYFAILKVHPTPFCVMDEIEAALDEANVVRYAKYMRRIAGKTQFIVITHRRGTMEEADVLYGVTMQERGISKVLTINMNDMARELNID